MGRESVLVSADWAEKNLDTPGIVFVEVDEDTSAYDTGHIPGAVKLDWRKDLQDQVRRDFVNQEQFEALLSARGIGNDDTVVLYGGNNNWFAAYAYWYFKLYGHGDVKLIDGGRKRGSSTAGRSPPSCPTATATQLRRAGAGHVDPRVPRRCGRRDRQQEPRRRTVPGRVRRPPARPGAPPAGAGAAGRATCRPRCPCRGARRPTRTARSSPTTSCASSTRRPGSTSRKSTIAYCRIGERSSHTWFVLHELLGHGDVKNYDGSWTEYGSLVGVPVALGDEPGSAS